MICAFVLILSEYLGYFLISLLIYVTNSCSKNSYFLGSYLPRSSKHLTTSNIYVCVGLCSCIDQEDQEAEVVCKKCVQWPRVLEEECTWLYIMALFFSPKREVMHLQFCFIPGLFMHSILCFERLIIQYVGKQKMESSAIT